jgi:glycerol uptake facilitator-like aquaporin
MSKYLNEFIGEFIGCFVITFTALYFKNILITGCVFTIMIFIGATYYDVSLNPVITFVHYINSTTNFNELIIFIIAELLGALAGFFIYDNFIKLNKIK